MKTRSHSLSIMLLKADILNVTDALKDAGKLDKHDFEIGEKTAYLYCKQNPRHPPSWVRLFKPHIGNALDELFNSGTAAVFLATQDGRFFAVTFGYGKSLLKPDSFEENFGLKIVLNTVDPEKLRSVDAQSLDAVPVHVRSQASVATSLSEFGIDIERDLVYAATGQPTDSLLGRQITGKDAIKLSVALDLVDLPVLLAKLLGLFNATTYKQHFAWIDNLSEVRDPGLITKLDDELSRKIQAKNLARTWISIPDIIDWADVGGFKYQQPKRGELKSDIDWGSYLEFLTDEVTPSTEIFKKHSVLCMSESSEQPIREWQLYRCIYCELEFSGHTYALNNGKWYRINPDFLNSVNDIIKQIPASTLVLPDYIDKTEAEYNRRVSKSNETYFALMDREMIRYGGGSSQIEFCDLYTTDKRLVHVKRYGGSSVLSHLFAQGLVSTRLLLAEAGFRAKVNEKLPPSHRLPNPENKPDASHFEVVYAIASNGLKDEFELPLFSKINLRNCYSNLQLLGIRVSLCVVPVKEAVLEEAELA